MGDAIDAHMYAYDEHVGANDDAADPQVGTMEVQILLSWFFDSATPGDVEIDVPRAA